MAISAPTEVRVSGQESGSEVANPVTFSAIFNDDTYDGNKVQIQVNVGASAEIIGTVDGSGGFTITDDSLDLEIDDIGSFNVELTTGSRSISEVITEINLAYQQAYYIAKDEPSYEDIAVEHVEGPASYIKLISPTPLGAGYVKIGADDQTEIGLSSGHPDNPASGFMGRMMWDSGWVDIETISDGERCEEIQYNGYKMAPYEVYYIRMRFQNTNSDISDWSAVT